MKIFFVTAILVAFVSTTWTNESRELFVKKYEATFGETPSAEVWNLGKASCDRDTCKSCSGCQKSI